MTEPIHHVTGLVVIVKANVHTAELIGHKRYGCPSVLRVVLDFHHCILLPGDLLAECHEFLERTGDAIDIMDMAFLNNIGLRRFSSIFLDEGMAHKVGVVCSRLSVCIIKRLCIVYHRHNLPRSVHGFNRQICIDEMQFDNEGNILPVVPTHLSPLHLKPQTSDLKPIAVTASSYYDEWFKPEYAVDDNNATLWKAANTNWGRGLHQDEWLQIDLGKVQKFSEIWTQFEYATFFYQYKIETSVDGKSWLLYADRTNNTMQGSPMIDTGKCKARYVRITITDTQKNGHMPAIWNVKIWKKAPALPDINVAGNDDYPGMHQKDVETSERQFASFTLDASLLSEGHKAPFDVTEVQSFKANKPIRVRVKDGRWALFFNGTQRLTSDAFLPTTYRYNAPYTISAWTLSTKVGPVSTVASLTTSRADLATTEFRLGSDQTKAILLMEHLFVVQKRLRFVSRITF